MSLSKLISSQPWRRSNIRAELGAMV